MNFSHNAVQDDITDRYDDIEKEITINESLRCDLLRRKMYEIWEVKPSSYAKDDEKEFVKCRIREVYIAPRDEVYNNSELMKAAHEEAKKRKIQILEMLESYKINIL